MFINLTSRELLEVTKAIINFFHLLKSFWDYHLSGGKQILLSGPGEGGDPWNVRLCLNLMLIASKEYIGLYYCETLKMLPDVIHVVGT
jgi:hypothetical protein